MIKRYEEYSYILVVDDNKRQAFDVLCYKRISLRDRGQYKSIVFMSRCEAHEESLKALRELADSGNAEALNEAKKAAAEAEAAQVNQQ
jgi:hypothetical protein